MRSRNTGNRCDLKSVRVRVKRMLKSEIFWCYMIWCGDIGSDVGSAFHMKMKAVFIALGAGYKIDAPL